MRSIQRGLLCAAALVLALAAPAAAEDRNVITLSPANVTIGADHGATQTVSIDGAADATITVEFSPGPPAPGPVDISREDGRCTRQGPATYVCEGWRSVTIRYPATEPTGLEVSITVRVENGRTVYGSVTVDSPPPPPPSSDPETEPSNGPAEPQQQVLTPLPAQTSEEPTPSTTPSATIVEALAPEDAGSRLMTIVVRVGVIGGSLGAALAVAGIVSMRRRREAQLQPDGPRPDVERVDDWDDDDWDD